MPDMSENISYEALNDALCRAIFTLDMANRPVYLELTSEVVDQVSSELCIDPNSLEELIFESVRSKLHHSNKPDLFASVKQELAYWFRDCKLAVEESKEIPNYPHIPLLLAFTISAADMGNEGGFSTNAYYPRLHGNLNLDKNDQLDDSYRKVALIFWNGLNYWLDKFLNSKKGIGTAYSISSHKYVGLALSQALLRSVDRKKLHRVFHENNLAPFTSLVEPDMERIINFWIQKEESYLRSNRNPSAPLKRLWEKEDARLRISSIACKELELWDGSIQSRSHDDEELTKQDFKVRLGIFESSFPSLKMNFSFSFNAPTFSMSEFEVLVIGLESEQPQKIPVSQDQTGWWKPDTSFPPINARDLMEGMLELDIGLSFNIQRYPKQLVVLRLDELSRTYNEVERIEIGTRSMVAVQDKADLVAKVIAVLDECARPGWQKMISSTSNGIPEGWLVVKDVEFVAPPAENLLPANGSLEVLKPIFAGSLNFTGGFQLPGRPPRWHSDVDFEIRGTVLGAETLELKILQDAGFEQDAELEELVESKLFSGSLAIWVINTDNMPDGNYKVQMFADSNQEPVTEKTLRLRSSDSIDEASWRSSERLVHDLTSSGIGAVQTTQLLEKTKTFIDGSISRSDSNSQTYLQESLPGHNIWWIENSRSKSGDEEFRNISLPGASAASCFGTSRHNFELPAAVASKSGWGFQKNKSANIEGKCIHCGLIKKFAANQWVAEKRKVNRDKKLKKDNFTAGIVEQKISTVVPQEVVPIDNLKVNYGNLIDGVMHFGGGSGAQLESLAASMDPGALFKYEFSQNLTQLAIIDCRLDDYFQITSWEVAPTSIVSCGLGGKENVITGFASKALLNSIKILISKNNQIRFEDSDKFSLPRIVGATEDEIKSIAGELNIPYSAAPTIEMLRLLPPIMAVAALLPQKAVPGYESVAKFEASSNSWVDTANIESVGAYRARGDYRNRYVIRVQDDLNSNSVRFVSAEFAKHFQAAISGTPLMAYDSETQNLMVPIGAPLPGLYGRACVLASGRLPVKGSSKTNLMYPNIEEKAARLIAAKFGGKIDE